MTATSLPKNSVSEVPWNSHRLVSLWDMITIFASEVAEVWPNLMSLSLGFFGTEKENPATPEESRETLDQVISLCGRLAWADLEGQAKRLLSRANAGQSGEPMAALAQDLRDGFHDKLMETRIVVIDQRDHGLFSDAVRHLGLNNIVDKLASSAEELNLAGRALAVGLSTASVSHAMRAVEASLHVLAHDLKLSFPAPIELQQWVNLTEKIKSEIERLEQEMKSQDKTLRLQRLSELMLHADCFRLAWRNHVAHAREKYEADEARAVLEHVSNYLRRLSEAI